MASNNRWNDNPKGEGAMIEVLLLLIQNLKKSLDEWKGSWTAERANKLDRLSNLDKSLSGVESNIGRKIDNLVTASQGNNPNLALSNLTNKIDALKQNVDTKSSQGSVNKVGQDLNNIGNTISNEIGQLKTKQNAMDAKLESMDNTVDTIALDVAESKSHAKGAHNIVSKGVIKRVQRGELNSDDIHKLFKAKSRPADGRIYEYTVNLPYAVNVGKSIVLCNIASAGLGTGAQTPNVGCTLNQSTINLYMANYDNFFSRQQFYIISWQVIEYY